MLGSVLFLGGNGHAAVRLEGARRCLEARGRPFELYELSYPDVASWEALAPLLPQDRQGNARLGDAVIHDSEGCLTVARGDRRLIVLGAACLFFMVVIDPGIDRHLN